MSDLIDRQAAIDAVETIGFDFSDSDLSVVELEEVCEAIGEVRQEWSQRIKLLPSAQPEGIYYFKLSDEDYEKIAEQIRKTPMVLTFSEPEIIRCGECKHHEGETYCHKRDGLWYENDYCSYAERGSDE